MAAPYMESIWDLVDESEANSLLEPAPFDSWLPQEPCLVRDPFVMFQAVSDATCLATVQQMQQLVWLPPMAFEVVEMDDSPLPETPLLDCLDSSSCTLSRQWCNRIIDDHGPCLACCSAILANAHSFSSLTAHTDVMPCSRLSATPDNKAALAQKKNKLLSKEIQKKKKKKKNASHKLWLSGAMKQLTQVAGPKDRQCNISPHLDSDTFLRYNNIDETCQLINACAPFYLYLSHSSTPFATINRLSSNISGVATTSPMAKDPDRRRAVKQPTCLPDTTVEFECPIDSGRTYKTLSHTIAAALANQVVAVDEVMTMYKMDGTTAGGYMHIFYMPQAGNRPKRLSILMPLCVRKGLQRLDYVLTFKDNQTITHPCEILPRPRK